MTGPSFVRYWRNGWRLAVVVQRGRNRIRLMEPATFERAEFDTAAEADFRPADDVRPARVARIIEDRIAALRRQDRQHGRKQRRFANERKIARSLRGRA